MSVVEQQHEPAMMRDSADLYILVGKKKDDPGGFCTFGSYRDRVHAEYRLKRILHDEDHKYETEWDFCILKLIFHETHNVRVSDATAYNPFVGGTME